MNSTAKRTYSLADPLTVLPGVGPAAATKFAVLGVRSVHDLLTFWPRRYEDYATVTPTDSLRPGGVTVAGTITSVSGRYVRRGLHITEALASDAAGSVRLVWFNQPYRTTAIKAGQRYFISGTYELSNRRFAIMNPAIELEQDLPLNTARIIPVYRETKGISSRQIRAAMAAAKPYIQYLAETLPGWLVEDHDLLPLPDAVSGMHFPESLAHIEQARRRLGFEEVFQLSLASLYIRREQRLERALPVVTDITVAKAFSDSLPFTLTDGQRAAAWQIIQDMAAEQPMNRLLEGDVGSGKTVVATMAALLALRLEYQVVLMAPTELLARQHAETVSRLLQPHGLDHTVGLLVGSLSTAQKQRARQAIKDGRARYIIGTQALIQESVDMHTLALIIIDEQHRFGVEQRKTLMLKAGHMPHVLSMTATPIPRSLALTLYGELDVSVLKEKPIGRQPIITELVSPNSRAQLYDKLNIELQAGRQAFVVCPLIADSAALQAESAEAVYERLSKRELKQWRIGLLHGKLKPAEKQAVMERFIHREIDILVTTTVIEVGVDVPNASVMLVESPERFGLAQLHQLRGRVGRGQDQGYCYLMLSDSKTPSRRLQALVSSTDGFRLSELDLELRGPGAIHGSMQHGALDLRIARLSDTELVAEAQAAARSFIDKGEDLLHYTELAQVVKRLQAVTNLN